jgi:ParB-like chromosome segregation protein Spo0J
MKYRIWTNSNTDQIEEVVEAKSLKEAKCIALLTNMLTEELAGFIYDKELDELLRSIDLHVEEVANDYKIIKDKISELSNEDQDLLAQIINHEGTHDHPWASDKTLPGFAKEYVLECIEKAISVARTESIKNRIIKMKEVIQCEQDKG